MSLIRYNPANTKYIIPGHCVIQHTQRILMPNMAWRKNLEEIWNVITDIFKSLWISDLSCWFMTQCSPDNTGMSVSFIKMGQHTDKKCIVMVWKWYQIPRFSVCLREMSHILFKGNVGRLMVFFLMTNRWVGRCGPPTVHFNLFNMKKLRKLRN